MRRRNNYMGTLVAATMALGLAAADGDEPLRVGKFEDGRVVVSPGLAMADAQPRDHVGAMMCTTGFLAADRAYLEGQRGGNRYLLTSSYCVLVKEYGEQHDWARGDGLVVRIAERNPALVLTAAGVDQRGEAIGHVIWTDQTVAPSDAGLGFLVRDAAIVALDDDVSVDPEVPGLGVPRGVAQDFRSVASDGAEADVVDLLGRGLALGEVAAHRQAVVLGRAGGTHLCLGAPGIQGDYGAPILSADGRAAGLVQYWDGVTSTSFDGEPCAAGVIAVQVLDVLDRFHETTGIELTLLTERAGPILR